MRGWALVTVLGAHPVAAAEARPIVVRRGARIGKAVRGWALVTVLGAHPVAAAEARVGESPAAPPRQPGDGLPIRVAHPQAPPPLGSRLLPGLALGTGAVAVAGGLFLALSVDGSCAERVQDRCLLRREATLQGWSIAIGGAALAGWGAWRLLWPRTPVIVGLGPGAVQVAGRF